MTVSFRLGGPARKAVLLLHIVAICVWLGVDVALAILVFTAEFTASDATAALCYQAIGIFAIWPLIVSSLVSLVSGVVLGLGSKYGLVKYWWVTVKLVLNVVLSGLIVFLLRPGLAAAAEYGEAVAAGRAATLPEHLFMPPAVSMAALLVATVLTVYKPWGRTRRRIG
ncbi:hypothetical protein [Longispora albida]|uniref:hypothetical protein n=1 Tax=Longispora albida TaxID=203523 RepID=UPI00036740C0|nr:hypothetical protein [Longispora albida]